MTLDFDFFKILSEYIRMYKAFPLPVVLCDDSFRTAWSNATAKSLYPHAAEGDGFRRLLGEFDLPQLFARIAADGNCILEGVIPFSGVQISLSPILHAEETVGVAAIFFAQQLLPSLISVTEQSFTASALEMHLRQSVADIFGAMDDAALKADLFEASGFKRYLNRIAGSGYHILRTAANISAFSQYQSHSPTLRLTALDLFATLTELLPAMTGIAETVGITLRLALPEHPAIAAADPDAFQLAFFNVLHNALYFSRPGDSVEIAGADENNHILLTVTDSGAGIAEPLLPEIFRPYFARGHDGKPAGLGLGLPVAKAIIDAHGGALSVTSRPSAGTVATMKMPKITPAHALPFAQGAKRTLSDRFSAVYIGLADVHTSPYLTGLPE